MISGGFPSRFLKSSFQFWSISSLARVLLLRCPFFRSQLSAMPPVIVYILLDFIFYWFGLWCIIVVLFSYVLVNLFPGFVMFINLGIILSYLVFPKELLTPMELYIWLLVCLVCTQLLLLPERFQSFHIRNTEYVFQSSPNGYQTCFIHLLYIDCLYHHWHVRTNHIAKLHVCFIFLRRPRRISTETILWSEYIPLKEEKASHFKALLIHFFFINT